jgi:glutamate racemase
MAAERMDGPVGVFDSGVGGISVLREIRGLLPALDLTYAADSAHCPYGTKSDTEIRARACATARFLIEQRGARAVVVACNTATAAAIDSLRETFADVPIVGMEPAVKPAAAATRSGVVGVLATGATLGGERFAGLAARFSDGIELLTQACPGLVEQVESGALDAPATLALLRGYVEPLLARGADVLVLGCTHYPFLRPALAGIVGPEVAVIDTGAAVARQLARVLDDVDGSGGAGSTEFWNSDTRAAPVMERLWGEPVDVRPLPV